MNTSQNIHWNRQLVRKEPYSELYSDIQNLSCHSTDITLGLTLLSYTWPTEMKDLDQAETKQSGMSILCQSSRKPTWHSCRTWYGNETNTGAEHGMGMRL